MKNKKKSLLLLGILILLSLTFVSAAPPQSTTNVFVFDEGYIIVDNPQNILSQSQAYQVNFFVYNQSNGIIITNETSSTNCTFYLAQDDGNVIFTGDAESTGEYWKVDLSAGNFSELGIYGYRISCQGTELGGALSGEYEVTPSGSEFTNALSLPLFLPMLLMLLITAFFFYITGFVEKKEYKITFLIFGGLFLIFAVSFGIIASRDVLYGFPLLYGFVNSFYKIFVISLRIGAIIIPLIVIFFVIKRAFNTRGYNIGNKK